MIVARLVAEDNRDGRESADGLVERVSKGIALLRSLNRRARGIVIAGFRPALALVMRLALRETVSTRALLLCMRTDAELRESILLQNEASGVHSVEESAALLSRLVELSALGVRARAAGDASKLKLIVRLIQSAKPALYASLEKAKVGKLPMYPDPMVLAERVIMRLQTVGPYESIRKDELGPYGFPVGDCELEKRVREFMDLRLRSDAIEKYGPLCLWDVSAIEHFAQACAVGLGFPTGFDSDLFWNTESATDMTQAFGYNKEFKGYLGTWDVSNVTGMSEMFTEAGIEDSGIANWNTARLISARHMFLRTEHLSADLDLSRWTFGPDINMGFMFGGSNLVDGGIGQWNVADANTGGMLADASKFTGYMSLKENWPPDKLDSAKVPGDRQRAFGVAFGVAFGSGAAATTHDSHKKIVRVLADALRTNKKGAKSSEGRTEGRAEGRQHTSRRQKGQKGEETCAIL